MKKLSTEEFIKKAKQVHGDKYDYSKTNYINTSTKIEIICPTHGSFWQTPMNHLRGHGCPGCSKNKKMTTDAFIEAARKVHGNKYNYSKVEYINANEKVEIICPLHGSFLQSAHSHLSGCGCPHCYEKNIQGTTESFIQKARKVHGDKYDYSKVEYINNRVKVCIVCPNHGEFWQTPHDHLAGKECPRCKTSRLENAIKSALMDFGIKFEEQRTWEWLVYRSRQYVDFFLPEFNIVIECQGKQHFEEIEFYGGKEGFEERRKRDENKLRLCEEHGLKVLYYSKFYLDYEYPYQVYTDIETLINTIKTSPTN